MDIRKQGAGNFLYTGECLVLIIQKIVKSSLEFHFAPQEGRTEFVGFFLPQVIFYEEELVISELQSVLIWWGAPKATTTIQGGIDKEKLGLNIGISSNDHKVANLKILCQLPALNSGDSDDILPQANFMALVRSFWPNKKDIRLSGPMAFADYNLPGNVDALEEGYLQRCGFWGRHRSNFLKKITMDDVELFVKAYDEKG